MFTTTTALAQWPSVASAAGGRRVVTIGYFTPYYLVGTTIVNVRKVGRQLFIGEHELSNRMLARTESLRRARQYRGGDGLRTQSAAAVPRRCRANKVARSPMFVKPIAVSVAAYSGKRDGHFNATQWRQAGSRRGRSSSVRATH